MITATVGGMAEFTESERRHVGRYSNDEDSREAFRYTSKRLRGRIVMK